jgi:hypothetical protein
MTAAVSDGRGGHLTSGTNAPLYSGGFTDIRPKEKEQVELHERRLAGALDLDRVSRVLEFRDPSTSPQKSATIRLRGGLEQETRTVWTGSEWATEGPEFSKL